MNRITVCRGMLGDRRAYLTQSGWKLGRLVGGKAIYVPLSSMIGHLSATDTALMREI